MNFFNKLTDSILKTSQKAFGETVVITFADETSETVNGIFENDHLEVDQGGVMISTSQPILDLRLADLSQEPNIDDLITARDLSYRIDDVRKDGRGSVSLILTRV